MGFPSLKVLVRRDKPPPVAEARAPAPDALLAEARAAASGDPQATRRLLRVVGPRVLRVVRSVLGASHADTEDVVQESLLGFLNALKDFRGESAVLYFASCIAFRRALEAKRRTQDVGQWLADFQRLQQAEGAAPLPPSELAFLELRRELLAHLLTELPKAQAEALALRAVTGMSIEKIAEASDCPANTVRSRLRLAKEALRRRIAADPRMRECLEGEI
jgi:RNA polymerase sigma-70 factor (ECF subfamily)